MNTWKILRYVIVLIVIGFVLYKFFPYISDIKQLQKLRNSILFGWVIAAFVVQILQYVADGLYTKFLLSIMGYHVKLKDSVRIASLDVFASHILPVGRVGSLASVVYFYHKLGVKLEAVVFLNFIWGIITAIVLVVLFLLSLPFLPDKAFAIPIHLYLLVAILLVVAVGILFGIAIFRANVLFRALKKLLSRFSWYTSFENNFGKWHEFKEVILKHKFAFFGSCIGAGATYYLTDVITLYVCFLAFGVFPDIPILLFAYTASVIAGTISFLPAGLGVTDATLGVILIATAPNQLLALGAIVLFRLISFWLPIPAGAISFVTLQRKIKNEVIS